jgi:DNA-binding NtrC family response regulator
MPGMNGIELFHQMHRVRPELPGIFLTGFTTIDVVYPAITEGILRFVSKPLDFDELKSVVDECCVQA